MNPGRCLPILSVCLLLAACSEQSSVPPVVVYADMAGEKALPEFLAGFTDETRIPVNLVFGASRDITDGVMQNDRKPPADVLITSNVADIWRAADDGALRPLSGTALEYTHSRFRSPEGFWIAAAVHWIGIAASDETAVTAFDGGFKRLGEADMHERICVASSELAYNRALIASLIDELGMKPAERLVRRWIRNLAAPPFTTEQALQAAVRERRCEFAILPRRTEASGLTFIADERYVDIDGVGVARHARHPESAQRLVEWIARQGRAQTGRDIRPVAIAGWLDEDARLLAERAGFH